MANTLGDLAQSFMMQRRSTALKTDMHRLTQELATGRVADTKSVLAGNFSYFTDIERDIRALEGYKVSTSEASQFAGTVQTIVEDIQDKSSDLANSMLLLTTSAVNAILPQVVSDSKANLGNLINRLNTSYAGRTLLAGAATDTAPLASDEDIAAGLTAAIAGQTDLAGVMTAAQDWFDDPAGFRATMYLGSDAGISPYRLSDDDRVSLDIKADDPVFRDVIMNTALGAIIDDPALALSDGVQKEILSQTGQNLLAGQDSLTNMRADIGFTQARIEDVTARNSAEAVSLEYARTALLGADPYETATKLEEVQFQLQSLYSVTVRLSEMSLLNFMR